MDQRNNTKITAVGATGVTEQEPVRQKTPGKVSRFFKKLFVHNWELKLSSVALAIFSWLLALVIMSSL